jgi:molybdate transport system regulatory protein
MARSSIRFRVDFEGRCSVGFGKIALLEGIARTGSVSQAAREMDMSYRRAWFLVDSLNQGFDQPAVTANIGGIGGGGASVTPFGHQIIRVFRALETKLIAATKAHMRDIARHVAADHGSHAKPAAGRHRQRSAKSLQTSNSKLSAF